jgi:hypothetical protein
VMKHDICGGMLMNETIGLLNLPLGRDRDAFNEMAAVVKALRLAIDDGCLNASATVRQRIHRISECCRSFAATMLLQRRMVNADQEAEVMNVLSLSEHVRTCSSAAAHGSIFSRIASPYAASNEPSHQQLYEACCRAQFTSSALLGMFISNTIIDDNTRNLKRADVARESAQHARREALACAAAANISLVASAAFPDAQVGVSAGAKQGGGWLGSESYAGAAAAYTIGQLQASLPPSTIMVRGPQN